MLDKHSLDLSFEDIERDGVKLLARLRRESPVVYIPKLKCWVVTRANDVAECQFNEKAFVPYLPEHTTIPILGSLWIQAPGVEGERWMRYRKANEGVLAPRVLIPLVDRVIRPAVERRIAAVAGCTEIDLLADFFGPINVEVLNGIIGHPELSHETVMRWYSGISDSLNNLSADPQRIAAAETLRVEIEDYFRPFIAARFANPDGGLISHLLKHAEGETLEEKREFIQGDITNIIFAGAQEPAHACVNLICGLLTNPDDFKRFRGAPNEHIVLAGEEGLRWLPPVAATQRRTRIDVEMGGVVMPAGEDVIVSLISANLDEDKWGASAARFQMDRFKPGDENHIRHMTFGMMPRFCQGAPLVRTLMKVAVPRLFESFPNLSFAADVQNQIRVGFLYNVNHLNCRLS